ncbi:IclR family transcriptional regulator [Deinococcus sp. UYEF24]
MLGTFEKAGLILDLYTPDRPEWGVKEAARALGQPPSSVHLLLTSLTGLGLLHRTAAGRYRLGFRLLSLSHILLLNTPWREVAREEMEALERQIGETLVLDALDGGMLVRVESVAGQRPGSVAPSSGERAPVHATASGKLMIAYRDPGYVNHLTQNRPLQRHTSSTITDPDELRSELQRIRERGLAFNIGEYHAEQFGVSAPVRNHNGEVIAALTIRIPPDRYESGKLALISAVVQSAARISGRIGYSPDQLGRTMHWASVAGQDALLPVVTSRAVKGASVQIEPPADQNS